MGISVDLNCDMGEGMLNDAAKKFLDTILKEIFFQIINKTDEI